MFHLFCPRHLGQNEKEQLTPFRTFPFLSFSKTSTRGERNWERTEEAVTTVTRATSILQDTSPIVLIFVSKFSYFQVYSHLLVLHS